MLSHLEKCVFQKGWSDWAAVESTNKLIFLGIASAFQSRDQIFSPNPSGTALKIDMLNRVFAIHPYPSFPHFAQNLPSMLPAIILDPKPKETILDMCAAPGGKTTHLLEILAKQTSDFSSIYACEKSKSRSKKLMENCKGHNMHIIVNDASKMDSLKDDNGPTVSFESYFDKILLDAPCSGTGQRPRKIVPIDDDRQISKQHIKVQQKLFKNAVKMLKSGGVLVYSTCSVQIEENHDIIDWALKNFDLNLQVPDIPFGVKSDQGILFNPFTTSTDSIDSDTIGFFVTKLIKK